jgi:hypothetical protein
MILLMFSVLAATFGCTSRHPIAPEDRRELLAEKIKSSRYAYLRFAQAEEDARKEGDAVAVEKYQAAKEKARQDYERFEQELSSYQPAGGQKPAKARTSP